MNDGDLSAAGGPATGPSPSDAERARREIPKGYGAQSRYPQFSPVGPPIRPVSGELMRNRVQTPS